ncbi:helix-turn-helix transcriptional regulator [Planococcus beigongshangi]|uniref:helix-turn-helix transcriptional regulator n=1 Tax=Planococcus beigongshangi TaxID=2782536 RepID=UPI00193B8CE6|nr:helix-turn-helix transcriptional regulator [Planococcus beigongshangi]
MREWLKTKRLEAGLTQEEAAKKAGIARTTYAMIEQGERDPSVSVAAKIAGALKFKWTIFFDNKVHETRNEKRSAV